MEAQSSHSQPSPPRPPTYLVPLDGSRLAESVLPAAQTLAARLDARLLLLHVIERAAPSEVHGERHLATAAEARAYLEEVAGTLRSAALDVATHVHEVGEHDVARSVSDHVGEYGAELVILCTHGSGGLRGFLFGSIAQQILERGTRSLLLIRPRSDGGAPSFEPRRLFVVLEGGAGREPALEAALGLARPFGAALHLAVVIPTLATLPDEQAVPGLMLPTTMKAVLDLSGEAAEDYLRDMRARCQAEGVAATSEVLRGDRATAAIEAAERDGADLIAVATQGEAGLRGRLSGSVPLRLTDRVTAPILFARANTGG